MSLLSTIKFPAFNLKAIFILFGIISCLHSTTTAQDSTKTIVILPGSKNLRQIQVDSATTLITLAGNAAVRQGRTIIKGDSIVVNQATGIAEVFGNVHINDADTVNTYAQYLKYLGKERIAYLKKKVKLTDGKGTLLTEDLEYNLATGIANYKNGGRVLNGKTVLTSEDAVYYEDTKDVYFKKYVHLTDPKYDIVADSLLYNTARKEARFIAPTTIKSKDGGTIKTSNGYYNLETGKSEFYDRTAIADSNYYAIGDNIAYDEKAGILQIKGRGKIVDSVNNVTMLGGLLYLDKATKSFLGTQKPLMILYRNADSTYIAADTLYSGVRLRLAADSLMEDPQEDAIEFSTDREFNTQIDSDDGIVSPEAEQPKGKERMKIPSKPTVKDKDRLMLQKEKIDSAVTSIPADSIVQVTNTAIKNNVRLDLTKENKKTAADSVRYFLGFNHVRIFNDSLQAVCDSMYYSTADSVFRMYRAPVFWNDKTQVSGDTMYLFTTRQKPRRLKVYNNSMVINQTTEGFFNQISGRTLNGYFVDGNIDYIRVKGTPAESIFYPQDEDSAYVGMNKSKGDVIDTYFRNKALYKIKFINDVDGTLYPFRFITEELKFLKGFLWQETRRPKTKFEMYE